MRRFFGYSLGVVAGGTAGYAVYDSQFRAALPTNFEGFTRFARTSVNVIITAADYKLNVINKFSDFDPLLAADDDLRLLEYKENLKQCNIRAARRLFKVCKAHGGVYNKFAQYVSTMNHVLPKEALDIVAPLQDKAKQISKVEAVEAVSVELEKLGHSFEDLFLSFEAEAIASASLAQVHHAIIMREGQPTDVAVKIQYPHVRKLYNGDLATLKFLATILGKAFPQLEYTWLVPEFEGNMILELNFKQEARNGERLRSMFKDQRKVYVPEPFPDLTTEKLLVMEFIEGWRVDDHVSTLKSGINPLEVAGTVSSVFGDMIHVHGFVHCDPHAGNLMLRQAQQPSYSLRQIFPLGFTLASIPVLGFLALPQLAVGSCLFASLQMMFLAQQRSSGYELVVLDHGMYRRLEPEFRRDYCQLWKALLLQDDQLGIDTIKSLNIKMRPQDYDLLTMSLTFTPSKRLSNGSNRRLSKEQIKEIRKTVEKVTLQEVNDFLKQLPRDLLFVMRCSNIVRSINKSLGGTGLQRFRILGESAVRGMVLSQGNRDIIIEEREEYSGPHRVNLPVESELIGQRRSHLREWVELWRVRLYLEVIELVGVVITNLTSIGQEFSGSNAYIEEVERELVE